MRNFAVLVGIIIILLVGFVLVRSLLAQDAPAEFDGERAMQEVEAQVALGPRLPGSQAHAQLVAYFVEELEEAGWSVEIKETSRMGHPVRNVVARRGEGRPWVVLGAHYDTRQLADRDPDPAKRAEPVPGANDGASGAAVLLELARALPEELEGRSWAGQIWLVFFDAEDQGDIPGWDWILGSQAFVDGLLAQPEPGLPDSAVIVDMIGDADLNIHLEQNSDPALSAAIWSQAAALGYVDDFIPTPKYSMLDDHTPFLRAGVPAVDLIDFDYPYWHTTGDTPDKVSAASLEAVGKTLLAWLLEEEP
jgi:hypothetical protein